MQSLELTVQSRNSFVVKTHRAGWHPAAGPFCGRSTRGSFVEGLVVLIRHLLCVAFRFVTLVDGMRILKWELKKDCCLL